MSEYRHRLTGEIKSQGEWRRSHPNTSFPRVWSQETLDFLNIDAILASPKPTPDQYQTVRLNGAVKDNNNNWVENWEVVDMFSDYTDENGNVVTKAQQQQSYQASLDAAAATNVRAQRDRLIAETDWWASSDLTMTAEQTAYRQALRDITSQAGFPHNVAWPEKPL